MDGSHHFCTACGTPLVAGDCPRCAPAERFCSTCGTALVAGGCPSCPAPSESADLPLGRRPHWVRLGFWLGFIALIASANFVGNLVVAKPSPSALPEAFQYSLAFGGLVSYAIFLGVALLISAGLKDRRRVFALERPPSWKPALWAIPALLIVSLFVLGPAVEHFLHPGREQGVTPDRWVSGHLPAFLLNFLVVAVVAPVVEELTFRGLGFSLFRFLGEWPAVLAVGLTFGLAHGLLGGLPLLVPFGCALALMRSRMKSVYPGMIAHGCYNAVVMLAILLTV